MKTLFVDTSKKNLLLALVFDGEVISNVNVDSYSKHSNFLMNELTKMLDLNKVKINDVDNFVIVNGPGSFTGVRVGVTVVKTLSFVLKNNIYSLTSLKALALNVTDDVVISVIYDKNSSSYVGIYKKEYEKEGYFLLDDVVESINKSNVTIVSVDENEYAKELCKRLSLKNNVKFVKVTDYDYVRVVNYALSTEKIDTHLLEPLYIKKIDVEKI